MSDTPNGRPETTDGGELPGLRRRLLAGMLRHAPFDGWSDKALTAAARDEGIAPELAAIAFQDGPAEVADFFQIEADRQMVEGLQAAVTEAETAAVAPDGAPTPLKLREKVALAVRTRLLQQAPHREALRALAAFLASPAHAGQATRGLWRTVDAMWRAIGDTSTDFNYYSKRALLAGVYGSTVLVWFDDSSEDFAETFAFLDRRIADVMAIETCKARLRDGLGRVFRRSGGLRGWQGGYRTAAAPRPPIKPGPTTPL
jgi:ubiquinone biosynthesis protein COQ9